jgi:hypothetical protein
LINVVNSIKKPMKYTYKTYTQYFYLYQEYLKHFNTIIRTKNMRISIDIAKYAHAYYSYALYTGGLK